LYDAWKPTGWPALIVPVYEKDEVETCCENDTEPDRVAGARDSTPIPTSTEPTGVRVTVTLTVPENAESPVFFRLSTEGAEPKYFVPPPPILEYCGAAPVSQEAVTLTELGDAAAAGDATAVTMTGTDHATPLTTRRRLKPLSFDSISSFKISDNCAPTVGFSYEPASEAARDDAGDFRLLLLSRTLIKVSSNETQVSLKTLVILELSALELRRYRM